MSSKRGHSPDNNEMVLDCLPKGTCSGFETATKSKELRRRNEAKRRQLKDFFERNTLCRMPKCDVTVTKTPTFVIIGFEGEGADGVYSILEGDAGETPFNLNPGVELTDGSNGVIAFKNKLRLDKPNLEFEEEFTARKAMLDRKGDAIFILVVNGATPHGRVYDQYYVRSTMTRIKRLGQRRCMLVLTHADTFLKGSSLADHFGTLVSGGGPVGPLCCMVYPHIVAIETADRSFYRVNQQRSQLFSLADRMILVNSHELRVAERP